MAAPTANVAAYLAQQKKSTDKELATEWNALEDLYNEKYLYIKIIMKRFWLHLYAYIICRLWNELTIRLIRFIRNPALQNEKELQQLYQNFIQTFEMK